MKSALDEIKARLEAATPGPWEVKTRDDIGPMKEFCTVLWMPKRSPFRTGASIRTSDSIDAIEDRHNFNFIVHSRTDVERLVKALELCRDQRDAIRFQYFLLANEEQGQIEFRKKQDDAEIEAILRGEK